MPEHHFGLIFAIWYHYSFLCNRTTTAYIDLQNWCKWLNCLPSIQRRKWNHFTESKVTGPETVGPASYPSSLPSKMSCPILLVPGSLLAPLTLLKTLVATVLLKLWERVPRDSIVTIQLSLLSGSPPLTLPNWGLFQHNVGILCLALPPPSCLRVPFHIDTWAISHRDQAVLHFLWSLHWGIHFKYPITFLKNFGIQHKNRRKLEFPLGLKAPFPLRNPSRISCYNV